MFSLLKILEATLRNLNNTKMTKKEIILKQLNSISNETALKYNKLYSNEINEIAEEIAISFENLLNIIDRENQKEILDNDFQAALIFWSSANTLLSSIELFSRGYPREHLVILRHNLELISTAYCIHKDPQIAEDLLGNDKSIKSSKNISEAKKVYPILGPMYGKLSDSFTHISTMHIVPNGSIKTPLNIGGLYEKDIQQYKFLSLSMILTVAEMLNGFIEIVFFDKLSKKRYWEHIGDGNIKHKLPSRGFLRILPES